MKNVDGGSQGMDTNSKYSSSLSGNGNFARRIKGRSYRLRSVSSREESVLPNTNGSDGKNICVGKCSKMEGNNSSNALAKRVQIISKSAALASKRKVS